MHGRNMHPGSAKNRMKHAARIAMEFNAMLPVQEKPEYTEGYEGFYHLTAIRGDEENAEAGYILRDHDAARLEQKKRTCRLYTSPAGACAAGSAPGCDCAGSAAQGR